MRPKQSPNGRCGNALLILAASILLGLASSAFGVVSGQAGNSSTPPDKEGLLPDEFPYHTSVFEEKDKDEEKLLVHICNGVILSHKFVLTAAHCFNGVRINEANIVVKMGCRGVSRCRRSYDVSDVVLHPKYKRSQETGLNIDDLAILVLKNSLEFDKIQPIAPIAMVTGKTGKNCTPGLVVASSVINQTSSDKSDTSKYRVTLMDEESCSKIHGNKTDRILCVKSESGSFLPNLSGGLLVSHNSPGTCSTKEDLLFGLVSYVKSQSIVVLTNLKTSYDDVLKQVNKQLGTTTTTYRPKTLPPTKPTEAQSTPRPSTEPTPGPGSSTRKPTTTASPTGDPNPPVCPAPPPCPTPPSCPAPPSCPTPPSYPTPPSCPKPPPCPAPQPCPDPIPPPPPGGCRPPGDEEWPPGPPYPPPGPGCQPTTTACPGSGPRPPACPTNPPPTCVCKCRTERPAPGDDPDPEDSWWWWDFVEPLGFWW